MKTQFSPDEVSFLQQAIEIIFKGITGIHFHLFEWATDDDVILPDEYTTRNELNTLQNYLVQKHIETSHMENGVHRNLIAGYYAYQLTLLKQVAFEMDIELNDEYYVRKSLRSYGK